MMRTRLGGSVDGGRQVMKDSHTVPAVLVSQDFLSLKNTVNVREQIRNLSRSWFVAVRDENCTVTYPVGSRLSVNTEVRGQGKR